MSNDKDTKNPIIDMIEKMIKAVLEALSAAMGGGGDGADKGASGKSKPQQGADQQGKNINDDDEEYEDDEEKEFNGKAMQAPSQESAGEKAPQGMGPLPNSPPITASPTMSKGDAASPSYSEATADDYDSAAEAATAKATEAERSSEGPAASDDGPSSSGPGMGSSG